MPVSSAEHDLLLGMLALHLDFLSREQLLDALKEWAADKSRPLAQVIRGQVLLTGDEWAALEALAQKHLGRHGHDARKSLASLPAFLSLREELGAIAGDDFRDTVSHCLDASADGDDPYKTRPPQPGDAAAVGAPTSTGRRFRVLRPHAEGGLGKVSVALDGELNREVALKEIQEKYADHHESRVRFLLEAEITGGLEHPGVVPVYGLGKHPDGRPFYAMRFIRGESLKDAIDCFHKADVPGREEGERGLALRQLLGRFVDVCDAMAYAHSRGVLHRDLKPGNVMLGKYGETLVVDWGLAKPLGERRPSEDHEERTLRPSKGGSTPQTRGAVGTPAYMSPEQAAGRPDLLGPASDVYSLGATLYTLLTGKPSIDARDLNDLVRRVEVGDFPRPRQVKPRVAPALEAVCLKAMALKPEGRYGSAKELAEDVEHWLAGEPVKAWPEPWRVRAGRWLKRHRTLVTSGVAALAVAVLVLAGATVLLTTAYENEREAKGAAETAREKETAAREAAETARRKEADAKVAALAAEADAKTQRDEALKQRKRADENFARAKKAVEKYLNKVTDHPKLKEHDFRDLRKDLLKTALPFYDDLRKQKADDPGLEVERGRAYRKLAFIRKELGEVEQAVRDYEVMREIFARLAAAHPAVAAYRRDLAESHNNRGNLLHEMGQRPEAAAAYREALTLRKALVEAHPTVPEYRMDLAASHNNLGGLLSEQGKRPGAEASYRAAIKLFQALVEAHPGDTELRQELAISHYNLGNLLYVLGRRPEAEAAYREALGLQQALVKAHPAVPEYRRNLAISHVNLGGLLRGLGRRPEAEAAYREALRLQQALAETHPAVPEYRRSLAISHVNLGRLLRGLGQRPEAEAAYREALKLRQDLAEAYPDVPDYRRDLAESHGDLGNLLRVMGQRPKAEAAFREALKLHQELAAAHPDAPGYRSDLAQSHRNLGRLLRDLGQRPEAEAAFREALKLRQDLAEAYPDVPDYRRDLAESHNGLGSLLRAMGKRPEAEAAHRAALTLLQALAEAHPAVPAYRQDLAASHYNLGNLLYDLGKRSAAEAAYREALTLFQALAKAHPAVPEYRENLAKSRQNLGVLLINLGKRSEAEAAFREAVQILTALAKTHPDMPQYRQGLAISQQNLNLLRRQANSPQQRIANALALARSGDHAKAAAAAEELVKGNTSNALYYGAACALAVCSAAAKDDAPLRDKYAARAVALLTELQAEGYFERANQAARLKQDADLDPLRQRDDFRKLLAQIDKAP